VDAGFSARRPAGYRMRSSAIVTRGRECANRTEYMRGALAICAVTAPAFGTGS
jgi:hypothetical protein